MANQSVPLTRSDATLKSAQLKVLDIWPKTLTNKVSGKFLRQRYLTQMVINMPLKINHMTETLSPLKTIYSQVNQKQL